MGCVEPGCDRPVKVKARGLCNQHYIRRQRAGTLPALDRFSPQIATAGPDDCWEWQGHRNRDGYGMFGGRPAHRIAYERSIGTPVPPDLHVDHECRNHACCNPAHLRPRDPNENMSDNGWRDRTECASGHPWTTENTGWRQRRGRRHRVCRACDRDRHANRRAAAA